MIWADLKRLLLPRWCCGCGQRLSDSEQLVCVECLFAMPLEVNHNWTSNARMKRWVTHERLQRMAAMNRFEHGNIAAHIIHELKYHRHYELGQWMGREAVMRLRDTRLFDGVDLLVPLPLTPARRRYRGFNQAEMIARGMADALGIVVLPDALKRVVDRESQTHFSYLQRLENARDVFAMGDGADALRRFTLKHGRAPHVMLIDDVMTTGTTMLGAVEQLEAHTDALISCFAWAWVPIH